MSHPSVLGDWLITNGLGATTLVIKGYTQNRLVSNLWEEKACLCFVVYAD
jgi:hypothetical protein